MTDVKRTRVAGSSAVSGGGEQLGEINMTPAIVATPVNSTINTHASDKNQQFMESFDKAAADATVYFKAKEKEYIEEETVKAANYARKHDIKTHKGALKALDGEESAWFQQALVRLSGENAAEEASREMLREYNSDFDRDRGDVNSLVDKYLRNYETGDVDFDTSFLVNTEKAEEMIRAKHSEYQAEALVQEAVEQLNTSIESKLKTALVVADETDQTFSGVWVDKYFSEIASLAKSMGVERSQLNQMAVDAVIKISIERGGEPELFDVFYKKGKNGMSSLAYTNEFGKVIAKAKAQAKTSYDAKVSKKNELIRFQTVSNIKFRMMAISDTNPLGENKRFTKNEIESLIKTPERADPKHPDYNPKAILTADNAITLLTFQETLQRKLETEQASEFRLNIDRALIDAVDSVSFSLVYTPETVYEMGERYGTVQQQLAYARAYITKKNDLVESDTILSAVLDPVLYNNISGTKQGNEAKSKAKVIQANMFTELSKMDSESEEFLVQFTKLLKFSSERNEKIEPLARALNSQLTPETLKIRNALKKADPIFYSLHMDSEQDNRYMLLEQIIESGTVEQKDWHRAVQEAVFKSKENLPLAKQAITEHYKGGNSITEKLKSKGIGDGDAFKIEKEIQTYKALNMNASIDEAYTKITERWLAQRVKIGDTFYTPDESPVNFDINSEAVDSYLKDITADLIYYGVIGEDTILPEKIKEKIIDLSKQPALMSRRQIDRQTDTRHDLLVTRRVIQEASEFENRDGKIFLDGEHIFTLVPHSNNTDLRKSGKLSIRLPNNIEVFGGNKSDEIIKHINDNTQLGSFNGQIHVNWDSMQNEFEEKNNKEALHEQRSKIVVNTVKQYHNFVDGIQITNGWKQGNLKLKPLNIADIDNWHIRPDAIAGEPMSAYILEQQKLGQMYITQLKEKAVETVDGKEVYRDIIMDEIGKDKGKLSRILKGSN